MKSEYKNKLTAVAKFALLLILLVVVPCYLYFFKHDVISGFNSLDDLKDFLSNYETASIFIYIGCQIVQIVICVIPGQAIQFAAGYLYRFWIGYFLSIAGVALGTMCTFYLARLLGKDAMYMLFGKERFTTIIERLNSKKALFIIFLLYLIPGLPKDFIGYAAGMSKIKFFPFLILSLAARTPAMMGSILIGSMIDSGRYTGVIILSVLFVLICAAAFARRKAVMRWIDGEYEKWNQ